ncbi:hypothetical protein AWB68_05784 [Caballeronia choica]|jgi:hypothetical protein|uniref:N-acetyltransferase domain-containing protein n=1 Tax=Caballeronia choica TaxID=326476 RepID=A0A158KG83_9BURK|nr:hypothetical protein [Caballeronia choica]SAL80107.1 hypothetical protein AWB68_05784 [Caballeronia choica]
MKWMSVDEMTAEVALPAGYRFQWLGRAEIAGVVGSVAAWYPDISVGGASCYLREDYLARHVALAGEVEKDVFVVLIRRGEELAGLFSCERDHDTLALYARLAVIAPQHRGARLGQSCIALAECLARRMDMGMVYGMATLKIPHVQLAFESLGWRLIGIAPGYDREMVEPGVVKRVYEAVYAKVLVEESDLLQPRGRNLTPGTRRFFCHLFPEQGLVG